MAIKSINGEPIGVNIDDDSFSASMLYGKEISITPTWTDSRFDTSVYVYAGVKYRITLTNYTYTGQLIQTNMFVIGDTSVVCHFEPNTVNVAQEMVFAKTGMLRIYSENTTVSLTFTISAMTNDSDDVETFKGIATIPTHVANLPQLDTLQLKGTDVFNSVATYNRSFSNPVPQSGSFYVDEFLDNSSESTTTTMTEPIRIKDRFGKNIYDKIIPAMDNGEPPSSGTGFARFDKNGKFINTWQYVTYTQQGFDFGDEVYFVMIQKYAVHGNVRFPLKQVSIDWLNPERASIVVDKSGNGDYTSLIDCLRALEDDTTDKTIIIKSGIYNAYEEMGGADYIATISNPSYLNWRDVSVIVPPNTHLVGKGNVTVSWDAPSSVITSGDMANLFSAINIDGSCRIENIKTFCRNGRYCIHDECSGSQARNGDVHEFINVDMIRPLDDSRQNVSYGCGHAWETTFIFKNCKFVSPYNECVFIHDWSTPSYRGSNILFDNCVFIKAGEQDTAGAVRFGTSITQENVRDNCKMSNCYLGEVRHTPNASANRKQAVVIVANNCNDFTETYTDYITDRVAAEKYNTIVQS